MTETIAVQLTGRGTGAIAVILVGGPESHAVVTQMASSPRIAQMDIGNAVHSAIIHPGTQEKLDDAMIVRTAQAAFELHVHGGPAVVAAVTAALQNAGVQLLTAEEAAAKNIFGSGIAGDLALALPRAKTMTAARLLAAQIDTGLTAWANHWQLWLAGKSANDLWQLHSACQWLLDRSATLAHLLDPPRIAIVGPPNAGKSTLANALLGRPVSITSEIAGTTRDWVDAQATFIAGEGGGEIQVAVTLIDTAGVRETADVLELESIARTHRQARAADAIILLLDASRPATAAEFALMDRYASLAPLILAGNKTDLLPESQISNLKFQIADIKFPSPAVPVSAKTHSGLDRLMSVVLQQLNLAEISSAEPFAFSVRQRTIVSAIALADDALAAVNLLGHLG